MNTAVVLAARQRRPKVAELYLQGKTQMSIAEILGVGQATVSRDLKIIQREWSESAMFDFDAAVGQELARIDNLERTYWQGWFDSMAPTETKESKISDKRGRESGVRTTDRKVGDKRFLDGVQWCIEQRIKLLGLAAPEKISLTWQDNLPEEYKSNPEDVQQQFAQLLVQAAKNAAGVNDNDSDD